jgi:hypothetical protein
VRARRIHNELPGIEVGIRTLHAEPGLLQAAAESGATGLIAKQGAFWSHAEDLVPGGIPWVATARYEAGSPADGTLSPSCRGCAEMPSQEHRRSGDLELGEWPRLRWEGMGQRHSSEGARESAADEQIQAPSRGGRR